MARDVSELDRLKEEVAYLKFWQGIAVVTDLCRSSIPRDRDSCLGSPNRASNRQNRKTVAMETIAAIVAFSVIVLIVGMALHAAYRK